MRSVTTPPPRRSGVTILELLVTSSVIGLLASILLPALSATREAARRVECTNHLKQIGLALHNYHDLHRSLPAGWQWESRERSAYGWGVALLPFLDQGPLGDRIDVGLCIEDPRLAIAREIVLPIYTCPSDVAGPRFTLMRETADEALLPLVDLPTANYVGVYGTGEPDDVRPTPPGNGAFMCARPVRFHEFVNGLSNTFLVGERSVAMLASSWLGFDGAGEDAECRLAGTAWAGPNCQECDECEFSSRHRGISQFLWGDGRVQGVSEGIDSAVYQQMARRQEP